MNVPLAVRRACPETRFANAGPSRRYASLSLPDPQSAGQRFHRGAEPNFTLRGVGQSAKRLLLEPASPVGT